MLTANATRKEIFLEAVQAGLEEPDATIEALMAACESELQVRARNDETPIWWYIGYIVGSANRLLAEKNQLPISPNERIQQMSIPVQESHLPFQS